MKNIMDSLQKELCPICLEGHLTEMKDQETSEHNGVVGQTFLHFAECDTCGSEQANAKHLRLNKRSIVAFKKHADNLLVGSEIKVIREKLGINQKIAALLFGGGPVGFSKYENDDVTQSVAMDRLIRVVGDNPSLLGNLCDYAKMPMLKVKINSEEKLSVKSHRLNLDSVVTKKISRNIRARNTETTTNLSNGYLVQTYSEQIIAVAA